ncbi:MAG: hypothetical protein AB1626_00975 [Candidatus Micrarchaeota archaeon]
MADEKKNAGRYLIVHGKAKVGGGEGEGRKPPGELAKALMEYIRRTSVPPAREAQERPTRPPAKKPAAPQFEDTLTGMPSPQLPRITGRTLFDELFGHLPVEVLGYAARGGPLPAPLSETEKQLIIQRIKDLRLAKEMTNPLNAGAARQFLEAIRWETRMVEKLEQHGFPRGVPEPRFFLPFGGPARGRGDFPTRFRALEALAWADSAKREWRDPVELRKMRDEGLKRILAHRLGEDAAKSFEALSRHVREEVLEAVKRYEELRHSLHEKGFDKSLPITHGLSEALDVLPTPLSEHLPELDRQLETLYKMRRLSHDEIARYANYARRIGARE